MLFDRLWTRQRDGWTLPRVPVDMHRLYLSLFLLTHRFALSPVCQYGVRHFFIGDYNDNYASLI